MGSRKHPGKFDCYNAAEEEEPTFTLLGRDPVAPFVVSLWAEMRKIMGKTSEEKIAEAEKCADDMARWASGKGKDLMAAADAMKQAIRTAALELDSLPPPALETKSAPPPPDDDGTQE